jgi:hypothetical protein
MEFVYDREATGKIRFLGGAPTGFQTDLKILIGREKGEDK